MRDRGLVSLIGSTWGDTGVSRGWRGSVTCNQGRVHMTDEPEVAQPAPSWIAVGSILARGGTIPAQGLMSLMGCTWGALGGSHGQQGRVT